MKQTTKEEVIKEAYGEYWDLFFSLIKDRILFNNGNLDYFLLPKDIRDATEKICDIRSHKSIFECTKTDEGTPRFFRPKSLKGIENNNGWTKNESEEDLPKEDVMYRLGFFISSDKFYQDSNPYSLKTALCALKESHYTHYQQIPEFKPPIF